MPRYRKLPVEIDAVPIHAILSRHFGNAVPLEDWVEEALKPDPETDEGFGAATTVTVTEAADSIEVKTAEGTMVGEAADWLIRGVQGELYPCKPEIFEATYEKVV